MSINNAGTAAGRELNLIEVSLSNPERHTGYAATAQFIIHENLSFQHADRYLNNIYVEPGQLVGTGDILASTIFEPSDILLAQQHLLQQELARFQANAAHEYSRLRSEIEELRLAIAFATGSSWERYSLSLSLYELMLEDFLLNRNHERENFRRQQADMYNLLAPEQLISPFCGVITFVSHATHGSTLPAGQRVISIADTNSLFFTTFLTHDAVVRYGDVFPLVIPQMAEFYVRVVNDTFAAGIGRYQALNYLAPVNPADMDALLYAVNHDWLELEGMRTRIYPTWNMLGEGITLPERIIHWDGYRPFVLLYENGSIIRRFVTLAPYQLPMRYVYIISGLEPGQRVVGE